MINKKSQQEMVGFVLIVIIVSIIGLIFLTIFINKKDTTPSTEVSNLLQAVMYYTSDCYSQNNEPKEVEDLINECNKNPNKKCYGAPICSEEILEDKSTEPIGPPISSTVSVDAKSGPWEHQKPNGNAKTPVLVLSGLKQGYKITMTDISGKISGSAGYYTYVNCADPIKVGFYDDNKQLISQYNLREFTKGIKIPNGATKLYTYMLDVKNMYNDNGGSCSFTAIETEILAGGKVVCTENTNTIGVCDSLENTLTKALNESLRIGDLYKNKAYNLTVYYRGSLDKTSLNNIALISNGNFANCSSVEGGTHTITIGTSGSGGIISADLIVCKGMGNSGAIKEETFSGTNLRTDNSLR